jgi:ABC-type transport system involved in multi-copper enzyme maturation permease subunit
MADNVPMAETPTAPVAPIAAARAPQAAPGYIASAFRVFDVSLNEMLWSRRTIFMGLLVGAPVLFALLVRGLVFLGAPIFEQNVVRNGARSTILVPGPMVFGYVMWMLYLTVIVPILGVFYGTSLMADEVEDKTITYLFVRPIRRGAVLLGKYLAYVVCTVFVVLPSVVLVYLLIVPINGSLGGSFIDLLKDLVLLTMGLAVYGAVFAFIGAKLKRPLLVGLIFIFGWEPAAMAFPGYMKRFTVSYYIQGLVPHAIPNTGIVSAIQNMFREIPPLTTSLFWLALIWFVFLAMGAYVVERREYVLEQ